MKVKNLKESLELDDLYLYCHKTQQYEIVDSITDVIDVTKTKNPRKGIKGLDKAGNKLYNQLNQDLFEELLKKFPILNLK